MHLRKHKIFRNLHRHLHFFGKRFSFKLAYVSLGGKIAFFGACICFIALFLPWVSSFDGIVESGSSRFHSFTSFSQLLGYIGHFIFLSLILLVFAIFSIQKKEKFHFFSYIQLSDHSSGLLVSLFIFLLSLHSFFLISGLKIFSANVLYGKGVILCITGSIIIFAGSLIMKTEYRKNIKGSYSNEAHLPPSHEIREEAKDNMKLPF